MSVGVAPTGLPPRRTSRGRPVLEAKAGRHGLGVHPGPRRGLHRGLGGPGRGAALSGRRPAGTAWWTKSSSLDDGSRDDTAEQARAAGARWSPPGGGGRQGAGHGGGAGCVGGRPRRLPRRRCRQHHPRLRDRHARPPVARPRGRPRQGLLPPAVARRSDRRGRVTELVARPVLELLFPELSEVRQPLAGETAAHRWVFEKVGFADGYGVEMACSSTWPPSGARRLAQVDLGERIHRNRPLHELRPQAVDVLRAALERSARRPLPPTPVPRRPAPRRLQPGPAAFRFGGRRRAGPARAAGGLASLVAPVAGGDRHDLGLGDHGRGRPRRGRPGPDGTSGLTCVPVVVDDDTYRPAYDVVANTTLWYCHHHLFDLPHRPRFDRHWREAGRASAAYNQAVADVVTAAPAPGRRRIGAGLSLLASRADAGRGAPGSAHGPLLHIPFADPDLLACAARRGRGRAPRRPGRLSVCGFHCHHWAAYILGCYAAAGPPAHLRPSWPRSAPTRGSSRKRPPRPPPPPLHNLRHRRQLMQSVQDCVLAYSGWHIVSHPCSAPSLIRNHWFIYRHQ